MRKIFVTILMTAVLAVPDSFSQELPAYKDASLPAAERAADLLGRLTLEQKVSLMHFASPAIPELGIYKYNWWSEALHGSVWKDATVFPQAIGMAASFNEDILLDVFDAVGTEQRLKFINYRKINVNDGENPYWLNDEDSSGIFQGLTVWTPNINLFRDPRWGRGQETYGEDPYLMSVMGRNVVNGLQRETLESKYDKLHACLKHYAVHSGPEPKRHVFDAKDISYRDLLESYLYAFEVIVKTTDVKEVMCAYNRVEGEPCCGSDKLLTKILRDEWGYKGLVVTDCWAIGNFYSEGTHNIFPGDPVKSSAKALLSGVDLECGDSFPALIEAARTGEISEKDIDEHLSRALTARFELGEMDPLESVEWNNIPKEKLCCSEHSDLAYKMAQLTMTLLRNEGNVLPLKKEGLKYAVVGPNAADERVLWGNYCGTARKTVSILEGIMNKVGAENVIYSRFCDLALPSGSRDNTVSTTNADLFKTTPLFGSVSSIKSLSRAEILDSDADVFIYVGGLSPFLEGEEMPVQYEGFLGGDRTTIELPAPQREALEKLRATGKPVIFVNLSGSAIALKPETSTCDAILQAWYPGQRGGDAVADVLFGDYNPGGRLPVTFYAENSQLPDFEDYNMEGHTYRYFDGEPLYPFGFGLSYTKFSYGKASILKNGRRSIFRRFRKDQTPVVSVPIKNTGSVDGDETVQVYIKRVDDVEGPRLSLRGFERVSVKAGEGATVDIPIEELRTFNERTGKMEVVPGKYIVYYGPSSDFQTLQKKTIRIK